MGTTVGTQWYYCPQGVGEGVVVNLETLVEGGKQTRYK